MSTTAQTMAQSPTPQPLSTSHGGNTPHAILFVHYGDEWLRGSERCLLDLISHLDRTRFTPVVWCNSSVFESAIKALDMNIPVYNGDFPLLLGWQSPTLDISGWRRLVKNGLSLVQDHRIQLIHANSGAPCQWLTAVSKQTGVPLIAHLHARYPARDRITLGLHHLTTAIGVSQPVIQQLLDDGVPERCLHVIPNGLDTTALDAQPVTNVRQAIGAPDAELLLITTGSLIDRKGVDLLIDALPLLHQQGLMAHLVILGEGESRRGLMAMTQHLTLQHHVHFLGEQTGIAGWLRGGADIYVSGAREEVFGLALAEASLCELAVIAPDVGGISSVIEHGTTGLLVTPDSVQAMTDAVYELAKHPKIRQRMGKAGRERILEHFTIEQNTQRFEEIYQNRIEARSLNPADTEASPIEWRWKTSARVLARTVGNSLKGKLERIQHRFTSAPPESQHILILDPTAFSGGSKIATEHILQPLMRSDAPATSMTGTHTISVLSADASSWKSLNGTHRHLYLPNWLANKQHGIGFFALNGWIALQVVLARLRLGRIDSAVGASGPGVDLGLYLPQTLLRYRILQLIHGPVATSRTIGRCLDTADHVLYLDTTRPSLLNALERYKPGRPQQLPETFRPFHNTLSSKHWPAACQYQTPTILWAASLLSWKGLPTLLDAIQQIEAAERPTTHICYIRPMQTELPITTAPVDIDNVQWHENPGHLNSIRASSNIFVSTSHQEPFGLSILEAMAAGHCVIIPDDGAYWATRLKHNHNCLTYPPGDAGILAQRLLTLIHQPDHIERIGTEAAKRALAYQSDAQPDSLRHFFNQRQQEA